MPLRYLILIFLISASFNQLQGQTCITGGKRASPIQVINGNNLTYSGLRIFNQVNSGKCIYLINCNNVRIENCVLGASTFEAIKLENCTNVTITNCYFMDNGTGIMAFGGSGIKVLNNQFLNMNYFHGGGQCVQFREVTGAGNEISYNVSEQVFGNSNPEDQVNLYKCQGTAASPILVKGNKMRGGGPRASGSGILLGDEGGSYQRAEGNILVDPGQLGIGIVSGHYMEVIDNKVYGRLQYFTNTHYYAYNGYAWKGITCGSYTMTGNEANYWKKDTTTGFEPWFGMPGTSESCAPIAGVANNNWAATHLGPDMLPTRLLCPLLVAHYRFNKDFKDLSGSDHHIESNVGFSDEGKDMACANFNGSNYLSLPHTPWLLNTSNRLTVSAWIKPTVTQGIQAIATSQNSDGYNDGWRLIMHDGTLNGRITTTLGSFEAHAGGIQAGAWNFVTMTYDGQQLKLYLNGTLSGTSSVSGNIKYSNYTSPMLIGHSQGTNYYFKGQMDEFKMYNGDFFSSEILQTYNEERDKLNFPRQLLASYKFNGSWNDGSGNNFHATSNGVGFWCDGADAVSAYFSGSSLLSIPANNILKPTTSKFYFSCWIKPTVTQGIQAIAHAQDADGYNNGWRFLLIDNTLNGRIVTNVGALDVYAGGIQAGSWNHVALMYDGTALRIYVNGQPQASTPFGGYIIYASGPSQNMRIGYSNGNNYYFNGRMDELRFYNGVITQQEVLDEFNTTRAQIDNPPPCPLRIIVEEKPGTSKPKSISNHFKIYPNPAISELFISSRQTFQAALYNTAGQRVLQGNDQSGILRLDTKDIKPGVYFLQITGKDFQETRKVLIQK